MEKYIDERGIERYKPPKPVALTPEEELFNSDFLHIIEWDFKHFSIVFPRNIVRKVKPDFVKKLLNNGKLKIAGEDKHRHLVYKRNFCHKTLLDCQMGGLVYCLKLLQEYPKEKFWTDKKAYSYSFHLSKL